MRVGGRSNSEILKPYNLRELIRSPEFKRSLPNHLRQAYSEVSSFCGLTYTVLNPQVYHIVVVLCVFFLTFCHIQTLIT